MSGFGGEAEILCSTRALPVLTRSRHKARSGFAEGALKPQPASLRFDVRGLDDWRPAGNFALHQRGERLLTSFCFSRSIAADIEKALAQRVVVERRVERINQTVEYRLRCPLRRKQSKPCR